jgi:hypothetical protein
MRFDLLASCLFLARPRSLLPIFERQVDAACLACRPGDAGFSSRSVAVSVALIFRLPPFLLPCFRWLPRQHSLPHFAAWCSLLTTQLVSTLFDRRTFFNTHHSFLHSSLGAASSASKKTRNTNKGPSETEDLTILPWELLRPKLKPSATPVPHVRLRHQSSVTPQRARVPDAPSKAQRDLTYQILSRATQHSH